MKQLQTFENEYPLSDMSEVREYVYDKHRKAGCTYGTQDFSLHLIGVEAAGWRHLSKIPGGKRTICKISYLCHDILEDTPTLPEELERDLGRILRPSLGKFWGQQERANVADYLAKEATSVVMAVTNELGKNRAERFAKTYPKIRGNMLATHVKLADRIANTLQSLYCQSAPSVNKGMLQMYLMEYPSFIAGIEPTLYPNLESIHEELNYLTKLAENLCPT